MYITPCPKCGRMPKIYECIPIKGKRHRIICCPNFCSVIPTKENGFFNEFYITYLGNGDDNTLFKEWNKMLSID